MVKKWRLIFLKLLWVVSCGIDRMSSPYSYRFASPKPPVVTCKLINACHHHYAPIPAYTHAEQKVDRTSKKLALLISFSSDAKLINLPEDETLILSESNSFLSSQLFKSQASHSFGRAGPSHRSYHFAHANLINQR